MTEDEDEDDYQPWLDDVDDDEPFSEMPHGVRFGEGQPRGRGRPPGSPNRTTILKRVARRRHKITIEGKRRTVSSIELVLHTIRTEASRGNMKALRLQEDLQGRYTERLSTRAAPGLLIVEQDLTVEEFVAVYGEPHDREPRKPAEDVLERFPHLRYILGWRTELEAQSQSEEPDSSA